MVKKVNRQIRISNCALDAMLDIEGKLLWEKNEV